MKQSTIRQFLKLANEPGMISFAGGLPAPELLPVAEITECAGHVLKRVGSRALQYGETEGLAELRDWIADACSGAHFRLGRENVLIVTGAQQGLDLAGRVFLDPGDGVAVQNPTYLAAISAWIPRGATFIPVKGDTDGMKMDSLEAALERKPKMIYLVPNFQNPQGTTLAKERRDTVARLLRARPVPLLEDDPYRELRYDGEDLPSIFSLQEDPENGHVIYIGTFSKGLAPGFRVGWMIGPRVVIEKAAVAKQAMDLHTSTFSQYMVLEFLRSGLLDQRLKLLRMAYRDRRDAMLEAMAAHFPAEVAWTQPAGGMFLFARLPEAMSAADLLPQAIGQRVLFVPGADFHVDATGRNTMRLNFTRHAPDEIREGIRRLGTIIEHSLRRRDALGI